MNCKLLFIALTLLIFASAAVAFADNGPTVSAGSQAVNVRSGPGVDFAIRGVLYPGYALPATGRSDFAAGRFCTGRAADMDMWIRITFNEMEGWVNRCAVIVNGTVDTLPVFGATNATLAENVDSGTLLDGDSTPDDGMMLFTSARANLRTSPSLNAEVLGVVPFNQPVRVLGRTAAGGWLRVQYGDSSGWIAAHLLIKPLNWLDMVPVIQ
ncbi:MAG: SH3 domain-containing protein [Chloroflexi bacterium]|nr:SH3 domain-containing protein [Chloroflexota bacterium]